MKNRFLSILLAVCMILSILPAAVFAANVEDFTDLDPKEWYYPWVSDVVKSNYFIGTSETTFEPLAPMTRGMVVTVLYRISGDRVALKDKQHGFTDVAADAWYADAVAWAKKNGITVGRTATSFAPDEIVNREEIATFIDRMLTYMAKRGNVSFDHLKSNKAAAFADADKISDWAKASIENCQKYGIIVGYPAAKGETANSFRPDGQTLRSEAAKIVGAVSKIIRSGISNWYWSDYEPPVSTQYSYTVVYHYGKDLNERRATQEFTYTEQDYYTDTVISYIPADYIVDDITYKFAGWSDAPGAGAMGSTLLKAGDTVQIPKNGTVTLYAVYTPEGDLVFDAMNEVVSDLQALAAKLNNTSVTVGGNTASMGTFDAEVTVSNLVANPNRNSFAIDAQATLDANLVERVLEMGTTYAVALLGPSPLPTRDELTDVVYDVAGQIGLTLNNVNVRAIADSVYTKLYDKGANIFANFKNMGGKFCIKSIDVEDGKMVLSVDNYSGLQGNGYEANVKMIKTLAGSIAREMYGKLVQVGGSQEINGLNVLNLYSVVTLKFTPAVAVAGACYTYDMVLNLNLCSDMVKYEWTGSKGLVTLTLNDALQTQYAESVKELADAALLNGTAKAQISKMVKAELAGNAAFEQLKGHLNAATVDSAVDAALTAWLDANLTNGTSSNSAFEYMYEHLWGCEEFIDGTAGNYSIHGTKVLGDNAALQNVVKTLVNQVANKVADDTLAEAATYSVSMAGVTITWNDLDATMKFGLLRTGVGQAMESAQYASLSAEMKAFMGDTVLKKFAQELGLADQVTIYETALAASEPAVNAYVDQMVMGALAEMTLPQFGGKTLAEVLEMLCDLKTVDAMTDKTLGSVARLFEIDMLQNAAAAKGNAFVSYVAKVIDQIPAGASVEVNGALLNTAALSNIRAAKTMPALCDAVADLLREPGLKDLSIDTFASAQEIVVRYNARTFAFDLKIDVE